MEASQETNYNYLIALPFYNLNEREYNSLFNISTKCLDHNSDLYNLLPNPDKADEIFIFHCNIRSLPKNLTLLNDMIYTLSSKPDVLAVTETKLNENTVSNVDISGYNFYHVDSLTAAGGTGIYVSQNLKTINRPDIKL